MGQVYKSWIAIPNYQLMRRRINLKLSDKKRVEKVRHFVEKNKVFTLIALLVMIWLLFGFISNHERPVSEPENSDQSTVQEAEPEEELHWQFYWSDLWILVIGGGFCTVMIIRERKKARETLK